MPLWQVSLWVQALPSLQATPAVADVNTQPMPGMHASTVHAFPSTHGVGTPPLHTPPPHLSSSVQALPSSHAVVLLL